uniref:Uncharacterized protein n=1 Tax=Guillardia theta TaxID=55529 RepID=A0A7S4NYC8_GUITH|mmetsp:Transcript_38370/g.120835  ORF Transcript_38370/g.120835 Transcript_38370/m.120835 type:complete len:546 (+) Transcript_38370:362-1999(+)
MADQSSNGPGGADAPISMQEAAPAEEESRDEQEKKEASTVEIEQPGHLPQEVEEGEAPPVTNSEIDQTDPDTKEIRSENDEQDTAKPDLADSELELQNQQQAATKIQARARGMHARREVSRRRQSAAGEQGAGQDPAGDAEPVADEQEGDGGADVEEGGEEVEGGEDGECHEHKAATKIQARARGMHARRRAKDSKSYGREVSGMRRGSEEEKSPAEEHDGRRAQVPSAQLSSSPEGGVGVAHPRKKKVAKFAGDDEGQERGARGVGFAKQDAHPAPQRRAVKLSPTTPPRRLKEPSLHLEEGRHARFASADVYEEIPAREEVSGSQPSEDGFSSEANPGDEEEDIPLSQLKGPVPLGSPRPHLFRYSPPADGAKPQRLELDSPRSGGESNESFSSGSKKMFRADHSPSRVEAGDDALLRGLKEKLASVEERIDSNQRLLLDSLDITQNVDVDTIQQANERVEKLMQLRQQILIAIEHQKRRSRAPEGDVSSDLILPSISPNKRVEQRRPRPPVAKEGVRLPHIPSSYSSVSPEQVLPPGRSLPS